MAKSVRHHDELAIVLFGSLGSGKSSTGNTILGSNKPFRIATGTLPITTKVESESIYRNDLHIRVIDTPGLQKASDFSKLKDDITRIIRDYQPGNVTYALVIKVGRYTQEEKQLIEDIFKKNKILQKKTIIIFTNREELNDEEHQDDREISAWVKKNPSLMALVKTYKLKYRAFENKRQSKEDDDLQVRDLISAIREEDLPASYCPVSDSKRKKQNLICVSRESMVENFGSFGNVFFEEQLSKQKTTVDDH